ncbi:hypothetical protein [Desulfococcus sp.]|uniref:hypothetical protein n=1 Tax=Desulfococcus sp. TaxID=2025834 RepID=UPI0035931F9F
MGVHEKLRVLDHIYRVYDGFIAGRETACRRKCARCCTRNVTLTTLEAYKIAVHLVDSGKSGLFGKLAAAVDVPRFIPRVTTNALADICLRGEEPPEEPNDPDWGGCPLLDDGECPLYAVRPYGCRCMVSARRCDDAGFAEMDPFVVTVNNVILQYIEHIDRDGWTGNLTDLLLFMASEESRRRYRDGAPDHPPGGLIRNHPVRALMVPPRHRQQIAPLIAALENVPPASAPGG